MAEQCLDTKPLLNIINNTYNEIINKTEILIIFYSNLLVQRGV